MSPGVPDAAVIRRHLAAMNSAVARLTPHAGRPAALLAGDEAWVVERGLQVAAQNALDVATHIAASSGIDVPDYASAIDALAQLGVVPADFAADFRQLAGFRNALVHGYLDVDPTIVHRVLNDQLRRFSEFAGHVETWLKRR